MPGDRAIKHDKESLKLVIAENRISNRSLNPGEISRGIYEKRNAIPTEVKPSNSRDKDRPEGKNPRKTSKDISDTVKSSREMSKPRETNTRKEGEANRVNSKPEATEGSGEMNKSDVVHIHLQEKLRLKANSLTITPIKVSRKFRGGETLMLKNNAMMKGCAFPNLLTKVQDGHIIINVINLQDHPLELDQGTWICDASVSRVEKVNVLGEKENLDSPKLSVLTEDDVQCGDPSMKPKLLSLLNQYRNVCWRTGEKLGHYTGDPLEIKLQENVIVNKRPYTIPHARREKLDTVIQEMLADGVISKSKSSFNSPLIIVSKPDGGIRPCIDYRELNKITVPITFPIPKIADLLSSLGQTKVISSLDLAAAYHQCEIREEDRPVTAFTVGHTKYEFNRIPYGLKQSPFVFCRIINNTLFDLLGAQVLCFMDDIIIYSKDKESHMKRLEEVLKRLDNANIKIKLNKCQFFTKQVRFLGYKITQEGMTMDHDRIKSIRALEYPSSKKQLQALLGACNYFRIFVRGFSEIAEPLYKLLRKGVKFKWEEEQSKAVDKLKEKLSAAPILKFPDFTKTFYIYTDASMSGIAGCLLQQHEGVLHPVSYISKCLTLSQRNYSTTKREALALVFALEQFRHLILYYPIEVFTDHMPLLGVLKRPTKDATLTRWALLVQEYDAKINYLPGKDNLFADALSRLTDVEQQCEKLPEVLDNKLGERVNMCEQLNSWVPEKVPWDQARLLREQLADETCKQIRKELKGDTIALSSKFKKFKLINNVLYVYRQITRAGITDEYLVPYIPDNMMKEAFTVIHAATTAGHNDLERTLRRFRKNFYNQAEAAVINKYVKACEVCLRAKKSPKQVPIQRYPIPHRPMQTVSMDILGPLPITARDNKFILVIRDYTTRYSVMIPLETKDSDAVIGGLRTFISNYGSSEVLLSDNAAEFKSEQMKAFCKFFNIRKEEVSPYHPSSSGLVERVNRDIGKLLRIYTNTLAVHDWDILLPVVQLTLNNTFNASLGETPFFSLFGYDSGTESLTSPKLNYNESDLAFHLRRVGEIRKQCRENLLKAQAKYTDYANEGRLEKKIRVGQRVYAKLTKHKAHHKLDLPISGPFTVIQSKGRAWELKDINTNDHYVVHPDFILVSPTERVEVEIKREEKVTPDTEIEKEIEIPRYNLRPRK